MEQFAKEAYNTIEQTQISLLIILGQLLDKGQTKEQILNFARRKNESLIPMISLALDYMLETGSRAKGKIL